MKALALHLIEGSIDQVCAACVACSRGSCTDEARRQQTQTLGALPPLLHAHTLAHAQVAQEVTVSWVASRVLTTAQVQGLKERLDGWISKVNTISHTLEQESIGVALEVV
jgi:hypothetical protein